MSFVVKYQDNLLKFKNQNWNFIEKRIFLSLGNILMFVMQKKLKHIILTLFLIELVINVAQTSKLRSLQKDRRRCFVKNVIWLKWIKQVLRIRGEKYYLEAVIFLNLHSTIYIYFTPKSFFNA